jgi:hypothetical protein
MPFVISRTGDLGFAVDVTYVTQDGTAVAGVDRVASSGTATVPVGQTRVTVNVPRIGKQIPKPALSFDLLLKSAKAEPTGVSSGKAAAIRCRGAMRRARQWPTSMATADPISAR